MKLKRLLTLCCALSMTLGMVPFVSAADYSFKTSPDPITAARTTRICMMPATTTVPATRSTTTFQKSSTA